MSKKDKSIAIVLDTSKTLDRVNTMNSFAEICRILHFDKDAKVLKLQIKERGGRLLEFDFKIK